jgi:uncharacterized protein
MNLRAIRIFAFVSLCAFYCVANAAEPTVELKGHRFNIELALDAATQQRGLMFRDEMPTDHGMLFIFDRPNLQTFWMKNCRMPLDILYFDANYKLINVQQRVPPCRDADGTCPVYPSTGPAQYVLELNAGTAEKIGVKAGDALTVTR